MVPFDKFVQSPKATFQQLKVDQVARFVKLAQDDALASSGTCSALAINVSRSLMDAEPDKYDFQMYDSGDHKICRCLKTFTIIDSSSEHHAIIKPPGETWRYQKRTFVWDPHGNGKKTNHATTPPIVKDFTPMTWVDGLASSIHQVAKDCKLVTFFRFNTNGQRRFGGLIKWYMEGENKPRDRIVRYLKLSASINDPSAQRIVWCAGNKGIEDDIGTPSTNRQCLAMVHAFVVNHGDLGQWKDCEVAHMKIWDALVRLYGYPVLKQGN